MYIGKVVGRVWATKKIDQLPPKSLLEVELTATKERIVALDPLNCGEGETVLVVTGSVVEKYLDACVDAAIVASLENMAD